MDSEGGEDSESINSKGEKEGKEEEEEEEEGEEEGEKKRFFTAAVERTV